MCNHPINARFGLFHMCSHPINARVGLFGTSYHVLMWKHNNMTSSLYQRIHRDSDYIIWLVTPAINPNKSKQLIQLMAPAHNSLVEWWRYVIVMSIPTRGNWFQTNPLEHESDDHADDTVQYLLFVLPMGKDMALQRSIWSRFVTILWFHKAEISDRDGRSVLVRALWITISKINWQFWHSFVKNIIESSYNFYSNDITWRKTVRSVCLKPVSMETWRLHTLWRFTLSAYRRQNLNEKQHIHGFTENNLLCIWKSTLWIVETTTKMTFLPNMQNVNA